MSGSVAADATPVKIPARPVYSKPLLDDKLDPSAKK
jgi:hypothetical protein